MSMRLEGGRELKRALREFPDAVNHGIRRGMAKGMFRVQRTAREKARVDTGRLRASIVIRVKGVLSGVRGIVGSAVHYAPHQEFGTKHMKAQPYLRPAAKQNIDDAINDIKASIARALRRIG